MASISFSDLTGKGIKSVQRAVSSFSGNPSTVTIPITAVDLQKATVRLLGIKRTDGGIHYMSTAFSHLNATLSLATANSIILTIGNTDAASGSFSWEVTELY